MLKKIFARFCHAPAGTVVERPKRFIQPLLPLE